MRCAVVHHTIVGHISVSRSAVHGRCAGEGSQVASDDWRCGGTVVEYHAANRDDDAVHSAVQAVAKSRNVSLDGRVVLAGMVSQVGWPVADGGAADCAGDIDCADFPLPQQRPNGYLGCARVIRFYWFIIKNNVINLSL